MATSITPVGIRVSTTSSDTTRQETQAILDAPDTATWAGQRDHALFTMFYNTGARVSEIIDLAVENLILDTSPAIHLTGKGRKQRMAELMANGTKPKPEQISTVAA